MFIGEYHHTIDEKGRVAVPVKFRKELANGAVVTKGLDACLFLYPMKEWEAQAVRIAGLPTRADTGHSTDICFRAMVEMDKQGRVVIPDYLRKFGGINKK